jgi:hypothetical protein
MLVSTDELNAFRDEVRTLLARAHDQLNDQERERLRAVIDQRHGDWPKLARDTSAEHLAWRLIGQLEEAEQELAPDQVRELESLIKGDLPKGP